MPSSYFDHIVIAAHTLSQGVEYIWEKLGVEPQGGGRHTSQGTHNKLLKLGQSCYLEIIATDPEGSRPINPRWFDLDLHEMKEKLLERPRLITWVARTDDIQSLVEKCKIDMGEIRPMSRGQLRWKMTFTLDGSLILGGQVPSLIQWETEQHPSTSLNESGCRLVKLEGFHSSPDVVREALRVLRLEKEMLLKPADERGGEQLVAHIETPTGIVVLD